MCTGNCNCSCDNISIPSIEGPQGTDGLNAFTVTTASFVVPAISSNVTIAVSNTNPLTGIWAQAGQVIYIENAGYYQVVSATATSMVISNLGYAGNIAPSSTISSGKGVSPSGVKGSNSTLEFDRFNATAPTGSWTLFSPSAYQQLNYTDYALSKNDDSINVKASINSLTSFSQNVSLRFIFNGSVLGTIPASFIPRGSNLITFNIDITRVTNVGISYTITANVTTDPYTNPSNKTWVSNAPGSIITPIADLNSPGNYPIQVAFEVNTDGSCNLNTQTLTSIKAI